MHVADLNCFLMLMLYLCHSSLSELSAAVRFVSKNSDGKIFPHPERIIEFFRKMDIVSVYFTKGFSIEFILFNVCI